MSLLLSWSAVVIDDTAFAFTRVATCDPLSYDTCRIYMYAFYLLLGLQLIREIVDFGTRLS